MLISFRRPSSSTSSKAAWREACQWKNANGKMKDSRHFSLSSSVSYEYTTTRAIHIASQSPVIARASEKDTKNIKVLCAIGCMELKRERVPENLARTLNRRENRDEERSEDHKPLHRSRSSNCCSRHPVHTYRVLSEAHLSWPPRLAGLRRGAGRSSTEIELS